MELIIDIPEEVYKSIQDNDYCGILNSDMYNAVKKGTPLHKGHGRLIDVDEVIKIANKKKDLHGAIWNAPTIIEADTEYETKIITRGNCMICGKELTEGLFVCKECEDKASKRK